MLSLIDRLRNLAENIITSNLEGTPMAFQNIAMDILRPATTYVEKLKKRKKKPAPIAFKQPAPAIPKVKDAYMGKNFSEAPKPPPIRLGNNVGGFSPKRQKTMKRKKSKPKGSPKGSPRQAKGSGDEDAPDEEAAVMRSPGRSPGQRKTSRASNSPARSARSSKMIKSPIRDIQVSQGNINGDDSSGIL